MLGMGEGCGAGMEAGCCWKIEGNGEHEYE